MERRAPFETAARRGEAPRWGVVSTIKAPLRAICRFAAWHLDLGASAILIHLDAPDAGMAAFLERQRRVRVTQCDDAYWQGVREKARATHQMRQAFNATRAYRRTRLDWLAHLDVDEFLLLPRPMSEIIAETPVGAPYLRLSPAEMLAQPEPWSGEVHFKLTRKQAGHSKSVLPRIYPEFGAYVPEGFLSYTGGKNIARTGQEHIRFGIHAVLQRGERLREGHMPPGAYVGHAHAPSWTHFERHFAYRLSHGSYRKKEHENMKLQDVLHVILEEEGTPGLRRFFTEMGTARRDLLTRLAAHDMLVTARLDLDARVARWFGELPEGA
ncbi:MAG TPA: hypothetical protein DEA05_00930 [Rhodobacteraceae bacterium]|nr:hypothetical protein [Paracoccaceae bacterium]